MQSAGLRALRAKYPRHTLTCVMNPDQACWSLAEMHPQVQSVVEPLYATAMAAKNDIRIQVDAVRAMQSAVQLQTLMPGGYCHAWGLDVPPKRDQWYEVDPPAIEDQVLADLLALSVEDLARVVLISRHSWSCTSNNPTHGGPPNKCYDNSHWLALAAHLKALGYIPCAVGSERDASDDRYQPWPYETLYGQPMPLLANLMKRCLAVIAVDTGTRHLAAAVGANLLCFSGCITLQLIACQVRPGTTSIIREHVVVPHEMTTEFMIAKADEFLVACRA